MAGAFAGAAARGAAGGGGINLTTLWVNVAPSMAGIAGQMAAGGASAANQFGTSFQKNWDSHLDNMMRGFEGSVRGMAQLGVSQLSDMFSGAYPKPPDLNDFATFFQGVEGMAGGFTAAMVGWVPVVGEVAEQFVNHWTGAFQEVTGLAGQLTTVLYEMGNGWQEIGREILGVTGSTRAELENYMTVVQQILASGDIVHMNAVVEAIGIIGDRMDGIDNSQLREFTTIVAQAQELLGDIDVSQMVAILNQWGVSADEAAGKFAGLVHVAQETKIPFDVLTRQLMQSGPILQEFGLNMENTASFLGQLNKEGIDPSRFAYQFQRAARVITEEGRPLKGALEDIFNTAKNMVNSGDEVGAQHYLQTLFGPYGFARITRVLKDASTDVNVFTSAMKQGLDENTQEINDQVNRTADLGEQFIVIRNRVMADLRVMSQGFADHLTQAGDNLQEWTATHHTEMLEGAQAFANGMITAVGAIADVTAGTIGIIAPLMNPLIDLATAFGQAILLPIKGLVEIAERLPDWMLPGGKEDWVDMGDSLATVIRSMSDIRDMDVSAGLSKISDGISRFSNEMLPNFRDWVNESMDPLVEMSTAFDDLADNVTALPDQKTFRLTGFGIREMEANLAKIGITFDKTADGTVTKVKAINEEIADAFRNWWEQNEGKELSMDLVVTPVDPNGNPIASAEEALPPPGQSVLPAPSSIPTIPGVTAAPGATLPPAALPATGASAEQIQRAIISQAQAMGFNQEQILAALAVANQETAYGTNPMTNAVQNQNGTPGITGVFQQDMSYRKYGDPRDPNVAIKGFLTEFANRGQGLQAPDPWAQAVAEVQRPANVGAGGYWDRSGGAGDYLREKQRAQALEVYNRIMGGAAPTTLPQVPTSVLPPSGLPSAPVNVPPTNTPPVTGPYPTREPQSATDVAITDPATGEVYWYPQHAVELRPDGKGWQVKGADTAPLPASIPPEVVSNAPTPTVPNPLAPNIIPPAGLPRAPLPPASSGPAPTGGTPTPPPASAPGTWTDASGGWKYWKSPSGGAYLVPPNMPVPTISGDGAPAISGDYHWATTKSADGTQFWVLTANVAKPYGPTAPEPEGPPINPQVGEPEGASKPSTEGPPPLTPHMVSGPSAYPGASPFPKTGTLNVAKTVIRAGGQTWMRYTFPDGTQYWASPPFLAENTQGVMSDNYSLPGGWVWMQAIDPETKQPLAGLYITERKDRQTQNPMLPPHWLASPYTAGDTPPPGEFGTTDVINDVVGNKPSIYTTLESPLRQAAPAPPTPPAGRTNPLAPFLNTLPSNPNLPTPQYSRPVPDTEPNLPVRPPNWWPEHKLEELPPGYHWEGGNSRWEIVPNGTELDPSQRRQGQYHTGGWVNRNRGVPSGGKNVWSELEEDEFVVNRNAALNHMDKLHSLNETGKWQGFDEGGLTKGDGPGLNINAKKWADGWWDKRLFENARKQTFDEGGEVLPWEQAGLSKQQKQDLRHAYQDKLETGHGPRQPNPRYYDYTKYDDSKWYDGVTPLDDMWRFVTEWFSKPAQPGFFGGGKVQGFDDGGMVFGRAGAGGRKPNPLDALFGAAGIGNDAGRGPQPYVPVDPLTNPIVTANPNVIQEQLGRVADDLNRLTTAENTAGQAGAAGYTGGAGTGMSPDAFRNDIAPTVFDARRNLETSSWILDRLVGQQGAVPLPDNIGVQSYPQDPTMAENISGGISAATWGMVPDVVRAYQTITNWDNASTADKADLGLALAGLIPLPLGNAARLTGNAAEEALWGVRVADESQIRHFNNPPTPPPQGAQNSRLLAGLPPIAAPYSLNNDLSKTIDDIWLSGLTWHHIKGFVRDGYNRGLTQGVPEMSMDEFDQLYSELFKFPTNPFDAGIKPPLGPDGKPSMDRDWQHRWVPDLSAADHEMLRKMGEQIATRAVASPATMLPIDRGMMVSPEMLERLTSGRPISFPLSSFGQRDIVGGGIHGPAEPSAIPHPIAALFSGTRSAANNAWANRQLTRYAQEGNTEGVIFSVLPGAQAARMNSMEQVVGGTFGVANVIPPSTLDPGSYGINRPQSLATIIELYQKSMLENPRYMLGKQQGGHMSGVVPYYGEIGRDSVHAVLEPDEFVVKRTVAMKHLNELWHLNETGAWPTINANIQQFQEGGEVGSPEIMAVANIAAQSPFGLEFTSGQREWAGTSSGKSYHLTGEAGDFSNGTGNTPEMLAFAQYMHDNYGGILAELIYSAPGWNGNLLNGAPHEYGAGTLAEHQNHVHVAIDSDRNGAGQSAPGSASLTPYSNNTGAFSPAGVSPTTGLSNTGGVAGVTPTTGGGGFVTDPYTGRQVRLGPQEFQQWIYDQSGQQQKISELQEDVTRAGAEINQTTSKLAEIQAERDKAWAEYEAAVRGIQGAAPGWMPGMPMPAGGLASTYEYDKKLDNLKSMDAKVAATMEELDRKTDARSDKQTQLDRELSRPPDRPKGAEDRPDPNAKNFGSSIVKGIMQELGFDGSVFENPLDWGIWKLFTGGVNYLGGLNKQMTETGAPGLFSGGPTGAGAAGDSGMSALTSLIPGVQNFMPGAGAPGSPTAGVPHAMTPTAGPGPAPNYGVPSSGGSTFNFNMPPIDQGFVHNTIVNEQRQSPATAIQANPSVVPVPAG